MISSTSHPLFEPCRKRTDFPVRQWNTLTLWKERSSSLRDRPCVTVDDVFDDSLSPVCGCVLSLPRKEGGWGNRERQTTEKGIDLPFLLLLPLGELIENSVHVTTGSKKRELYVKELCFPKTYVQWIFPSHEEGRRSRRSKNGRRKNCWTLGSQVESSSREEISLSLLTSPVQSLRRMEKGRKKKRKKRKNRSWTTGSSDATATSTIRSDWSFW